MRAVLLTGPDAGHLFPALAFARRLQSAGHDPLILTSPEGVEHARAAELEAEELPGLGLQPGDDDSDQGAKLHARAARMARLVLPLLRAARAELIIADVMVAAGPMAAEILGVPSVELSPHPLYLPSRGLPPPGSGLAPATNLRERLRDSSLRLLSARAWRQGRLQREAARASLGLPARDPGPDLRLLATLPDVELPRPDWPVRTHVIGPLVWEPTAEVLDPPAGTGPLVVAAPSTVTDGQVGLLAGTVRALEWPDLRTRGLRVASTELRRSTVEPRSWVRIGAGRQDLLLRQAAVLVCGGGHGTLMKGFLAGVPMVVLPGGGDQWELANRVARLGAGILVRPVTEAAIRVAVATVLDDPAYAAAARRVGAGVAGVADGVELCGELLAETRGRATLRPGAEG